MFSPFLMKLLNAVGHLAPPICCPKCNRRFAPSAEAELCDWREWSGSVTCPNCGEAFGPGEEVDSQRENPPGPFEQPASSRIERWETERGGTLYHLPSGGHWGGLLPLAIVWNLLIQPVFFFCVIQGRLVPAHALGLRIVCTLFAAIGAGLLYATFSQRFATYLLHLGPEEVRLRKQFLLRIVRILPTRAINSVRRAWVYSATSGNFRRDKLEGMRMAFAIEIASGVRRLRFGSSLTAEEQHWLVWEIREYFRKRGVTVRDEGSAIQTAHP